MKNSDFSNIDCDPEIMMKWFNITVICSKFHPEKPYSQLFFPQKKKKKIPSDIPKWSFPDFQTEPAAPFGNRKFFFLEI